MKLRISTEHYQEMRDLLALSFLGGKRIRPETGCILLIAQNDHPLNPAMLVAGIVAPGLEDFSRQHSDALSFSSSYLRRALLSVRQRGLAGFLTVHTHPLSDEFVQFSQYDDDNDPGLMANLYDLQPQGTFGSMVLGKRSANARLWTSGGDTFGLGEMVIVGEQYQSVPLNGTPESAAPSVTEIFDRGLAVTGIGALAKLTGMRIGVSGVSGTGSIMVELLVRAGAGEIVLFDFDKTELANLNRILHSRVADVDASTLKSDRAAVVVKESGLPTKVTVIKGGDIRNPSVGEELRGCDLIFGCLDKDWPRVILSEVCYQYLIPIIDIGTEIGLSAENNELQSLDSRVSYVAPGRPCLMCTGVATSEGLRLEGLSEGELDRTVAMGYSRDIRLKAPAVMDLNMRAASYAMLILRHLLQPFMVIPLPTSIRESLTNFVVKALQEEPKADCLICGLAERLGSANKFKLTTRHVA